MPGVPRPPTVPPYRTADLAALVGATSTGGEAAVTGVTHASGEVRPGDLYAALPGARRHGASFVAQAASSGAAAVLTDPAGCETAAAAGLPVLVADDPRAVLGAVASAIYGDPTSRLAMIGITGTAGKTSTAYLVEAGLREAGLSTGLIGTVETRFGDLTVDSVRTTPEATDLHAMLAYAHARGVDAVVMEVSSHALAMGRVGGVRFDVGGYTNFGLDHLDFHADVDDYFAAKAKLFDGRCRVEVLNLDDPALRPLFKPATVSYSAAGDASASWWASAIRPSAYGQRFTAHGPAGVVESGVALPGRHNVANALLAMAALTAVGVRPEVAARGVANCPGVPGRLEQVAVPDSAFSPAEGGGGAASGSAFSPAEGGGGAADGVLGVVDYAHKPDAIVAALAALRELATGRGGRLVCVIGAGGDRDTGKRPLMGAAAARGADVVVVTDDNPRTEDPAAIRAAVRAGAERAGAAAKIIEVAGRRAAIDEAVRLAGPCDVVAVLGKGHERGQEVGGEVLPFDDRVELAAALSARAGGAA